MPAGARLNDHPSSEPYPEGDGRELFDELNSETETVAQGWVEASCAKLPDGQTVQFQRLGRFCANRDSEAGAFVFNRSLARRDAWAKIKVQVQSWLLASGLDQADYRVNGLIRVGFDFALPEN